jgi:hypothetical protein
MRYFIRVVSCLAVLVAVRASSLSAQDDYTHRIVRIGRVELISHHPACNPFAMAFDPLTLDGRGIRLPRAIWHLGYPLLNTGFDASLKAIHTPHLLRTILVRGGLPLAPHLLQGYRGLHGGGIYQLNLYDWLYDFSDKQPIEFSKAALIRKAAFDVPLSCFARP